MTTYAVTVLGTDRPGIVAETTEVLAELGLNLTDSTMTLLHGHFAMTLVCTGEVHRDRVEGAFATLRADGALTVEVGEVSASRGPASRGVAWVLTVHGGDRPGIVSSVTRRVAALGGNITDLTTRLTPHAAGDLYLLVAEVDLRADVDPGTLREAIAEAAGELGVTATVRPADPDEL